jgi:hypothetical protein
MVWYYDLLLFVSGLFLANGVPHLVHGISGIDFNPRLPLRQEGVNLRRWSMPFGDTPTCWSAPCFFGSSNEPVAMRPVTEFDGRFSSIESPRRSE